MSAGCCAVLEWLRAMNYVSIGFVLSELSVLKCSDDVGPQAVSVLL